MSRGRNLTPEEIRHMHSFIKRRTVEERFWEKVDKRGPDDCWNWVGSKNKGGYGLIYYKGHVENAHRVSLRLAGVDFPRSTRTHRGAVVDHLCKNPSCVNPAHLRVTSQHVNSTLNSLSPHAENARKTHCVHGHPLAGDNLRIFYALDMKAKKRGIERRKPTRQCLACYRARNPPKSNRMPLPEAPTK